MERPDRRRRCRPCSIGLLRRRSGSSRWCRSRRHWRGTARRRRSPRAGRRAAEGSVRARSANTSMSQARAIVVRNGPGMTALTRTVGTERVGEPDRHRIHPGLGRRIGNDVPRGTNGPRAAHVDDRAAARVDHPLADQRREAERSLEVDGDHLVEQVLGDLGQPPVHGRDTGVVHEHVDAAEVSVDPIDKRLELIPVPDMARAAGGFDSVAPAASRRPRHRLRVCG